MKRQQRKVIIISIDTLRADHLGCYGYYRSTSPHIDNLTQESMFFQYAFAPISYTAPSFASLFTSKYPSYHHIEFTNGRYDFPKNIGPMLQQVLKNSGMTTAAFISTPVLNAKRTKFNEGFDIYDDEADTPRTEKKNEFLFRRGVVTTKRALEWLDKNYMQDFLLWVHYMDVHGPYNPPESYSGFFLHDDFWNRTPVLLDRPKAYNETYKDVVPDDYTPGIPAYQLLNRKVDNNGNVLSYEKNVDYYISQYDAAIKYVDDQIAAIISAFKKIGIYDDTLFIIHSDHGEAFGENGLYFDHGATVSLEQIHVPLIIKLPGTSGSIYPHHVSLLDVTPTILDFYGIDINQYNFHGLSIISESKNNKRIIYSQFLKQLSCIYSGYQLLYGKGWFEKDIGNIFGDNADARHKQLKASRKMIKIGNQDDICQLDSQLSDSIQRILEPFMHDFIEKANKKEKVVFFEENISDDEKEAIRKQLSALGYTD